MNNFFQGLPSGAGVVYVAFGAAYRELTVLSILWLRRSGYGGPVRVVTGDEYWPAETLNCEIVRVPQVGHGFATRHYKTLVNTYGYETTLFLDADTLPIASIRSVWRESRFAEMCITRDSFRDLEELVAKNTNGQERRRAEYRYTIDQGLSRQPLYSSGVMLFRRSAAADRFFAIWHEEWNRFQQEDQLALVRAIARTGFKVRTLAPRWNARLKGFGTIENARSGGARILHLRPWDERLVKALLQQPVLVNGDKDRPGPPDRGISRMKKAIAASLVRVMRRTV